MINTKRAVIYPQEGSPGNPVSINWDGERVAKATAFMVNVCRQALKESPPRIYRQIVFFYNGENLQWLKPFNL